MIDPLGGQEPASEPPASTVRQRYPSSDHSDDISKSSITNPHDYEEEEPRYAPIHTISSSDSTEADGNEEREASGRANAQAFIGDDQERELQRIATSMSHRRSRVSRDLTQLESVVDTDNDPALDPESKSFDLTKWLKALVTNLDKEGVKAKHAGIVYRNLHVSGTGSALQLQSTVGTLLSSILRPGKVFNFGKHQHKQILQNFDGIVKSGELLIVLGRPGSGCSTLLKTMCGELHGLNLDESSVIHYNGIPQKIMVKEFKGEATYNQEVDKHFPHLTVGQTLEFAASARTPSHRINGSSRKTFANDIARVVMAVVGLSHTYNTKVGNDFVRGVSGGERKRVSIAEMILAGSPFAAWDNSTRGLDSATALQFVQSLRVASDLGGVANAVAIYQASQAIYDTFDKATVLYEGRQIYFGAANGAKAFFERQGWACQQRQTTGDFLTSITNPQERKARLGMENRVPRTPQEFERHWRDSPEFRALQSQIADFDEEFPVDGHGTSANALREQKKYTQSKHVRPGSPILISIPMQVRLNTNRAYQRIWNNISATLSAVLMNIFLALVIGSIFYGTPDATGAFFSKGSTMFMAILLNALTAVGEISDLYDQRPIVEKHASYAFYHPSTEAIAGILAQIPIKFVTATVFNLIFYFMSGLRREPAQFFLYFLITYLTTFVMTAIFRTMAAITKTVSQALTLAGVLVLAIVIYTGFVIAIPQMHPWFSWIRYVNPVFYAFEILIANEFHGRQFACSNFVPAVYQGSSYICSAVGAVAGQQTVSGDAFIGQNYEYYYHHVWRNVGILFAFLIGFMVIYFVATEMNSSTTSSAEVLVFQHGHVPSHLKSGAQTDGDVEAVTQKSDAKHDAPTASMSAIQTQTDIFTWKDIVYDIEIKGEPRRLLDHASGWVKPGTLTALMGVSGAGKTTLLDALAQRTTMGIITGDMLVNGRSLDSSFQRKTGYVQQQDLHLETATVRESLRFSAMLRQPRTISTQEKYEFVEEVIKMLGMEDYANAVVGIPGQGLNVEQRKLLTIGVELAAKPQLLLFLDEPTSGLDSQSSWAICAFLRKLADAGQAILCTVHQPSAVLFQQFDRLLFLAKGGKTVYFGSIGENSRTLLDYFEANGARKADDQENPAEYMLEVVNNGSNSDGQDWPTVWTSSDEHKDVAAELARISTETGKEQNDSSESHSRAEFAMPFSVQLRAVTIRAFQQYWRMPNYILSKLALGIAAGLFVGFSFYQADNSRAGMQNIIFATFMLTTIFSSVVQQIQPLFISQRSLYEVRERPSKAYSWKAFMFANIVVELPWQIVTGICVFGCFSYAVTGIQSSERQGLVLLFVIQLYLYASAFAHMTIAAFPDAQTSSAIVTLLSLMSIVFAGVLQSPTALPGFWIFMYRVSPFTYWIGGTTATQLHDRVVVCSSSETSVFDPPFGQTCGQYLADYLQLSGGQLQNPSDTQSCRFCSTSNGDQYLAASNIYWSERWRNFGIMWAFIGFNIAMALLSYYLFRVKGWSLGAGRMMRKRPAEKKSSQAEKKDTVAAA